MRLIQLYKSGGLSEVVRGIRDWINYDLLNIHHRTKYLIKTRLNDSESIEIAGMSVMWTVETPEAYRRVDSHREDEVVADFIENISSTDVVWDIGANFGIYSIFASSVGAEVHAFEPGSFAQDILKKK